MKRFHGRVISGWPAALLAPVLVPVGVIAALWPGKKTKDRSVEEVAGYIRDFIEGAGGEWDWDEFESVPITDQRLDRIRAAACLAGPGECRAEADFTRLRALLLEVEAMAKTQPSDPHSSTTRDLVKRLGELPRPQQVQTRDEEPPPEPKGL
jgi:hypothetical protein